MAMNMDVSFKILAGVQGQQEVDRLTESVKKLGAQGEMSGKAWAASMRMVPAQLTDIATQLAGGQSPFLILMQQGGQLRDMFGGIGPALRGVGQTVAAMANPFTVSAAAVGALTYAMYEAQQEASKLKNSVVFGGNVTGLTANDVSGAAAGTGESMGASANAAVELARNGQIAASVLGEATEAAIKFEKAGGSAIKETAAQMKKLAEDPAGAYAKLAQEQQHLSLTTYDLIKNLVESGRSAEASALAQADYAAALKRTAEEAEGNLGFLQRAMRATGEGASWMWDKILDIGREGSLNDRIAQTQENIERLKKSVANGGVIGADRQLIEAQKQLDKLEADKKAKQDAADKAAATAAGLASQAALNALHKSVAGKNELYKIEEAQLREHQAKIDKARAAEGKAALTQAEKDAQTADLRKQIFGDLRGANLELETAKVKSALGEQAAAYAASEKILEAQRSAGLVGEAEYYAKKVELVAKNRDNQIAAIDQEIAAVQKNMGVGRDYIESEKKLIDLRAQRTKIEIDASASVQEFGIKQTDSIEKIKRAYEEARIAAQDYLNTTVRGYQRDLEGAGMGDAERRRLAGRNQIEDKYAAQRQGVEMRFATDKDQSEENRQKYRDQLALIEEFRAKALAEWDSYYSDLLKKNQDWSVGATRALQNYQFEAMNLAQQLENVTRNTFKGMEDALVSFVMTGKLDFKSLANSIIADMIRINIQRSVTGPLAGILGSVISSFAPGAQATATTGAAFNPPVDYRASGGPVSAGSPYVIGERGPELFVPSQSGRVVPAGSFGGSSNVVVNVNVESGKTTSEGEANQLGKAIAATVREELIKQKRPGGLLAA